MRRRVVITGMGTLPAREPTGREQEQFRARSRLPVSDSGPADRPSKARFAGLLRGFDAAREVPAGPQAFDKHVFIALVAAREALAGAGVPTESWAGAWG